MKEYRNMIDDALFVKLTNEVDTNFWNIIAKQMYEPGLTMRLKFKSILIALSLGLTGCVNNDKVHVTSKRVGVAYNVDKFVDGDTTCYVYVGNSISCVSKNTQ
jgi:hypothetical protein